jgi:hypothetical protein
MIMTMQINSQRNPYAANQKTAFGCEFDLTGKKVVELCPRALKIAEKIHSSAGISANEATCQNSVREMIEYSRKTFIRRWLLDHNIVLSAIESITDNLKSKAMVHYSSTKH